MPLIVGLHYLVAFGLELALLLAAGAFGYRFGQGGWAGGLLALVLVAAVILVWARFSAPSSAMRLPAIPLIALKLFLFGLGTVAFWAIGWREMAIGFGTLAVLDLGAALLLHKV